jgi:hypothetical protein
VDHVGHDEGRWEEDQAEDEVEKELWPLRAATRAGQNAIAIQMMIARIDQAQTPFDARIISSSLMGGRSAGTDS